MCLLSLAFYVVIALRSGSCASNRGDNIDMDVITPDDLTRALEQVRIQADNEQNLVKALTLSLQSTAGQLSHTMTPVDTKYAHLRSLIDDILPRQLYRTYVTEAAQHAVKLHKLMLEEAEKVRGVDLYSASRMLIISCRILDGVRTLLEGTPYENFIERIDLLYRESRALVNDRPSSTSGFPLHLPMDSDTDVEIVARYMVHTWENVGLKQRLENSKALVEAALLPEIQQCETELRNDDRFPGEMRTKITENVEKEAARLFEGHQRYADGRVVEPESIFYNFVANALAVNSITTIYNALTPYLNGGANPDVAQTVICRNDLYTFADLIRRRLAHIEVDCEATSNFLDSALSTVLNAGSVGYFTPFHSAAGYAIQYGMLRIDDMKLRLTTCLARIESVLETTRDRL